MTNIVSFSNSSTRIQRVVPLFPAPGGVRKLRWSLNGQGKRGGLRVIYYFRRAVGEIWMITIYSKNARENIPAHVLKQMKEALEKWAR